MKRIIFSLMIIMAIFSIAGTGSLAYFSDDEAATDNTFQVGVWNLNNDSGTLTVTEPASPDSGMISWPLQNTGTVDAYLDLDPITLSVAGAGDLDDYLMVHLFVDYLGDGWTDGVDDSIYGTAAAPAVISGIASSYNLGLLMEPLVIIDIAIDWNVIDTYVPVAGDEVKLTIGFDLQPAP